VSRFGVVPLSWSLDHAGPMTRSVHDAALMLNAVAGFDRRDSATIDRPVEDFTTGMDAGVRGLRLGIPRSYFTAELQPAVERAWRRAIEVLVGLGATLVDVDFNHLDNSVMTGQTITRAEMTTFHHQWFTERPGDYSPPLQMRFAHGNSLSARDLVGAQRAREQVRDELWSTLDQADVLVTPTMPTTAPPIGSDAADMSSLAALAELTRFTYPFNLSGFPALSIPCGFDDVGLPIGLQLAAGPWQEALLFRVGHAYQQATDWHCHRPGAPFN
jgi:aspartyl-tRNA(Asn)/glutamyl-tRNA(Gln) amidotransferase subunit A